MFAHILTRTHTNAHAYARKRNYTSIYVYIWRHKHTSFLKHTINEKSYPCPYWNVYSRVMQDREKTKIKVRFFTFLLEHWSRPLSLMQTSTRKDKHAYTHTNAHTPIHTQTQTRTNTHIFNQTCLPNIRNNDISDRSPSKKNMHIKNSYFRYACIKMLTFLVYFSVDKNPYTYGNIHKRTDTLTRARTHSYSQELGITYIRHYLPGRTVIATFRKWNHDICR